MAAICLRLCILAATVLALSPAARADLKAYNAAVTRGDFPAAANEIATTWAGLNKSRKDIFVIGREFGWTAMLAGKPLLARDVVGSLSGSGVTDDAPELTAVLLAWANFRINAEAANRNKLFDALRARIQKPQADLISVRASQELFLNEWNRDAMNSAAEAASLAYKVVAELGPDMLDVQYEMRRFEAVARFVGKPDPTDFVVITALADEIEAKLKAETNQEKRKRLTTELANTLSWRGVEQQVLEARGRRLVDDEPRMSGNEGSTATWFPAGGDQSVPVCRVGVDTRGRTPKYPSPALSKRLPGYAIYAFDTGDKGALKSGRVLGSAPHESFSETIDEIMPAWRWKMSPGPQPPNCRIPETFVVHFIFNFGS
jgi:hypothetical protein